MWNSLVSLLLCGVCVCVCVCVGWGDESSETMTRIPACISLETTLTKCNSGLISIIFFIISLMNY